MSTKPFDHERLLFISGPLLSMLISCVEMRKNQIEMYMYIYLKKKKTLIIHNI